MSEIVSGQPWQVDMQRVTLFLAPGIPVDLEEAWRQVGGGEPDSVVKKGGISGQSVAAGPFGEGQLAIQLAQGRLDFFYANKQSEETIGSGYLGSFEEKDLDGIFLQGVRKWLASSVPFSRIAFGCNLALPAASLKESYAKLAELVTDVKIDVENSSDFLYQINKPSVSKVWGGVKLNRIEKWACRKVIFGAFQVAGSGSLQVSASTESFETFLELDLNTSPENSEFIPDEIRVPLLDELISMAISTATGSK